MRSLQMLVVCALGCAVCLVAGGCHPGTLAPLYTPETLLHDERIEGAWEQVDKEENVSRIGIEKEDTHYVLRFTEPEAKAPESGVEEAIALGDGPLRLGLVKLGGATFVDVSIHPGVAERSETHTLFTIPIHYPYRIEFDGDQMRAHPLDTGWLAEWLREHPGELAYVRVLGERMLPPFHKQPKTDPGERIILTATTEELQAFFAAHAQTQEAWSEPINYKRPPGQAAPEVQPKADAPREQPPQDKPGR